MKSISHFSIIILFASLLFGCEQTAKRLSSVASLSSKSQVISNITYGEVDSVKLILDAYVPAIKIGGPDPTWIEYTEDLKPVLLFLHGGGWIGGNRISRSLQVMPYVENGWAVVNADYRLLDQATMGGIIGDCRLALNWIYDNAAKYKFDTTRIVVSGESAGGHLALTTGLLENDDIYFEGRDNSINRELKVAAIVNWFGVGDLNLAAEKWEDDFINRVVKGVNQDSLFQLASPINFLTNDSPPIISIHGDQDVSARYVQSVILHKKLDEMGLKNKFVTVTGKRHGNFSPEEQTAHFEDIWKFMKEVGVLK